MNKLNKKEKKTVIKGLKIETKFNELGNNLYIRLIKGTKNSIFNFAKYTNNGKNLEIKLNDSGFMSNRIV